MLVYKWHLSGCSTGLWPLCYFSAPCTNCLVDQSDKLHQAADVQSKESAWFCRNLTLNGGGLGSEQSWNYSLLKRGGTQFSCFEYSRWMGAFASFRPDHLPKSVRAPQARIFQPECEKGLWSPQHRCEALESRRWNWLTQQHDLPEGLENIALVCFWERCSYFLFFPSPNLLTCSLTLQSWGAFC